MVSDRLVTEFDAFGFQWDVDLNDFHARAAFGPGERRARRLPEARETAVVMDGSHLYGSHVKVAFVTRISAEP